MNGNIIIVKKRVEITGGGYDWVTIASSKSNEIQTQCDTIEISHPTIGSWRNFITGIKSWSMNLSFLLLEETWTDTLLEVGSVYKLRIINRDDSTDYVEGDAIITLVKHTATRGNIANGSFSFKGTGALT